MRRGVSIIIANFADMKFLIFMMVCLALSACTYQHADVNPCTSIPSTVSFHTHILPIFQQQCSTSGCHSGSSPTGNLNLEDSVAFAQLMQPSKHYIDTITPTNSVLYIQMNAVSNPMPPTGRLDDCTIQTVLRWIQQGAKNN